MSQLGQGSGRWELVVRTFATTSCSSDSSSSSSSSCPAFNYGDKVDEHRFPDGLRGLTYGSKDARGRLLWLRRIDLIVVVLVFFRWRVSSRELVELLLLSKLPLVQSRCHL